jgi:hypothetical protein
MGQWLSIWIIEIRVDFGTQKWKLFQIVPDRKKHGIPTVAFLRGSGSGNGPPIASKATERKHAEG